MHKMKVLLKYAGALKWQYRVQFVDDKMKNIVDDAVSSNYPRKRSIGANNRFVDFENLPMKNEDLLFLQEHF